jgi:hypothetical protein
MKQKRKILRAAGAGRYHSFLSIGPLLGVRSHGLENTTKVEFLPQWEDKGATQAVLSKRALLIDLGVSDIKSDDLKHLARFTNVVEKAARDHPAELLKIVQAFGRSGSKAEREKALDRAAHLNLFRAGDPEPVAVWGVLLAIGAAILIAGCCQETDTECDSDSDTDNGTDGGSSSG